MEYITEFSQSNVEKVFVKYIFHIKSMYFFSSMCLAYFFVIHEYSYNQAMADVRSIGAGIQCLYVIHGYSYNQAMADVLSIGAGIQCLFCISEWLGRVRSWANFQVCPWASRSVPALLVAAAQCSNCAHPPPCSSGVRHDANLDHFPPNLKQQGKHLIQVQETKLAGVWHRRIRDTF